MARRRIYPSETENGAVEELHTPLDQPRILNAFLSMLQTEGLEPISMRKIADFLGVKAASLYYHVKDKDQLIVLLGEKIRSEVELPGPELDWREGLKIWACNFRDTLKRYRDSVQIMNATFAATPHRLAHIEFLYRVFARQGFPDPQIPWFASMLKAYVLGFVDEENRLLERSKQKQKNAGTAENSPFPSLPEEKYPHLVRLAEYTTSSDFDNEFICGIQVLLDGFEAQLAARK
ncbi:TetR/AcrR family transcriptional regulator [Paenibacillus sp. S-38]|uniref:TetR/AcrR family transcriptional regulator n=1 Tax=Paenibacillus sp. S-38 TaxID=3416710 RepID=UPI003CF3E6B4